MVQLCFLTYLIVHIRNQTWCWRLVSHLWKINETSTWAPFVVSFSGEQPFPPLPPPQFPWLVLAVFHISLAEWCGCPKTSIPRTLVSIDYLLSKQKIIVCYPDFRKRQSCWRYAFLIEFCIYGKGLNNAWRIFEWKRAKSKRSILCK